MDSYDGVAVRKIEAVPAPKKPNYGRLKGTKFAVRQKSGKIVTSMAQVWKEAQEDAKMKPKKRRRKKNKHKPVYHSVRDLTAGKE